MPITRTAFIDDDGTGKTGTVWDNAEKQRLYDQIDAALVASANGVGANWMARPYVASNFYGIAPLVWAPTAAQIIVDRYSIVGKICLWEFVTSGGAATGTAGGGVSVKTPPGAVTRSGVTLLCYGLTNGVWGANVIRLIGDHVDFARMDYGNIAPAANLYFEFALAFEIY